MKKLIAIIAMLLLTPLSVLALTAESDTIPKAEIQSHNSTYFNYNVQEVERANEDGATRTVYVYDYIIVEGPKAKANSEKIEAMKAKATIIKPVEKPFTATKEQITAQLEKEGVTVTEDMQTKLNKIKSKIK